METALWIWEVGDGTGAAEMPRSTERGDAKRRRFSFDMSNLQFFMVCFCLLCKSGGQDMVAKLEISLQNFDLHGNITAILRTISPTSLDLSIMTSTKEPVTLDFVVEFIGLKLRLTRNMSTSHR